MAKKPRINSLLDDVANKVVKQADTPPQGIRAYHGSPHDFDRFDPNMNVTAKHIYTTPIEEDAKQYGKNTYELMIRGKVGDFRPDARGPEEINALKTAYKDQGLSDYFDTFDDFVEAFDQGEMYQRFASQRPQNYTMDGLFEQGFDALRVPDAGFGGSMSESIVVNNPSIIEILRKYGLVPGGLLGAGYAMAPSNAEAAPSRPDWIGNDGAITGNPPWLRPDPNERGTLGKLWDAVTSNPTGTAKAVGGALTDAAKDYAKSVYADPSKGAADALELGVTAMGGAIPQAFWMAGSPDAANAGEDAILAQRRKMMQGLLSDR